MGHHHDHAHDDGHGHGSSTGRRLRWALGLTASFMVVEALAGWWTGSLALLADAAHMLTDSAALLLALLADVAARRPADARRSYGYGRFKVLASFVNGLALILLAVWIVVEALGRLPSPPEIKALPMLVVACTGLLINLVVFFMLHGGESDINVRGAALHVLGDLLASVAAIVSATVILFSGWTLIDALLSLLVAGLILRVALRLVRDTGHILLEGVPAGLDPEQIARELPAAVPGVLGVHHVHAWLLGANEPAVTLHVVSAPDTAPDALLAAVRAHLQARHGHLHLTVQIEHGDCHDRGTAA